MISCWQHVFVVSSNHFVFNLCRMRLTLHFVAFDLSFDIDTIFNFFCKGVQDLTEKRYKYWIKPQCTPSLIFKTKIRELQKCNPLALSREPQWLKLSAVIELCKHPEGNGPFTLIAISVKDSVAFDFYRCNRIPLTYIWVLFGFLFIPLVFICIVQSQMGISEDKYVFFFHIRCLSPLRPSLMNFLVSFCIFLP